MRHFTKITLAAILVCAATAAGAAPVVGPAEFARPQIASDVAVPPLERPHHPCHGRVNGTAHEDCGTDTGGLVGGLF